MQLSLTKLFLVIAAFTLGCNATTERTIMQTRGLDIESFSFDGTTVGATISDSFNDRQKLVGTGELTLQGVELAAENDQLDSIFVTLDEYKGDILRSGQKIEMTLATQPSDVIKLLGDPYWQDSDDGELILFYEYKNGSIELQFEFPDSKSLGFITIAKDGVLSDAEQRKNYGVTKDWPPKT